MAKHKGVCDGAYAQRVEFSNDVKVSLDVVNVGECDVRARLLRMGVVDRRKFVKPCDWTDPPLDARGIREIELVCRKGAERGECRFSYGFTAAGRYRGRCRAPTDPLRPRIDLKEPMDVTVTVDNDGDCDVHVKLYRREGAGAMEEVDDALVVEPGDRDTRADKAISMIAVVCLGDSEDRCRFTYSVVAR